jgi:hypothetical protein
MYGKLTKILIVALGTSVIVVGGLFVIASPAPAAPTIQWAPAALATQIATGGRETTVMSIKSAKDIHEPIFIRVVPALQPFVTVAPHTVSSMRAGQLVMIRVTVSAPADAMPGSFDGTIQVRAASSPQRVLARPLPTTITVCRCEAVPGLSVTYPLQWQDSHRDRLYSPDVINLQTSTNAESEGGVLNAGEAEIIVSREPLPQMPLTDVMAEETLGRKLQTTEEVVVGGVPGTRIAYTDWESPVSETWAVVVYIPHANSLYRFLLTYHVGDFRESEYLSDFDQMLSTVTFTN